MRRRNAILGAIACVGLGAANAQRLGGEAAVYVIPQAREQMLWYFTPATGPLDRFTSRPNAWYALLYLPMEPLWPMQLWLRQQEARHDIRLLALDAPPDEKPFVVAPLPLVNVAAWGGRGVARVSRFMLPAQSSARSVFVLVELWRPDGEPPGPLWVQFLVQAAPPRQTMPWWYSHADRDGRAVPPPSPLTQEAREMRTYELPMLGSSVFPQSGVRR